MWILRIQTYFRINWLCFLKEIIVLLLYNLVWSFHAFRWLRWYVERPGSSQVQTLILALQLPMDWQHLQFVLPFPILVFARLPEFTLAPYYTVIEAHPLFSWLKPQTTILPEEAWSQEKSLLQDYYVQWILNGYHFILDPYMTISRVFLNSRLLVCSWNLVF